MRTVGGAHRRARALRRAAWDGRLDGVEASAALADPAPGVRRAAAWALGVAGVGRAALEWAIQEERTTEGVLAIAVALARMGAPVGPLRERLRARECRTFAVPSAASTVSAGDAGWRAPLALAPPELEARFARALGDTPDAHVTSVRALHAARAAATAGDDGPRALLARAELGCPLDVGWLEGAALGAGRRRAHVLLEAWGLLGAPEGARPLVEALRALDVDPGAGFAQRRVAARALGRLGLPDTAGALRDAVDAEARDHEGRPGAGLGVQYPVRGALLLALGELQDPASVPLLVAHLGATAFGALGGLHLHAMEALATVGRPAVPALRAALGAVDPLVAAHAASVLHVLGEPLPADDARAPVADVLRRVRAGPTR